MFQLQQIKFSASVVLENMENIEHRAVIKYLFKKGLKPQAIHEDMVNTLGELAPSYSMVKKWTALFKQGRQSVQDDPRSGRPSTAVTPENVDKIHDMVLADRRVKIREIANIMGISTERVYHILTEELGLSKVCARWVPRLLTPEQKRVRHQISQQCLDLFSKNPKDFMRRFITTDETWVHHYTPELKEQSKQWKHRDSPPPKKAKTTASAGKIMASVFWDAKGIIMIDYLPKGKTITGEYYANLLDQLKQNIAKKRPGLDKKKIIFHHDNAPAHSSRIVASKIKDLHFELIPHAPYSPDLAPSDYHLFPNLKKHLAGHKFSSNEEVIEAVDAYFADLDESVYKEGIGKLEHRWNKCITLRGDYVEK